jgi:uncharacterized UBP type Zn finger protein
MTQTCTHVVDITEQKPPVSDGCVECLTSGSWWLHLRRCIECGHVGCCDSSPNRHATAHFHASGHPLVQSYEPGEDWYWCYVDNIVFETDGEGPSPSHP